jgi:hypothetical protein
MHQRFTMLFLAFAVLFASAHVSSWSHEHSDSAEHALEASHSDGHHDSNMDADGHHNSGDKSDFSSEVVHHHFYPAGIEVAGLEIGHSEAQNRTVQPLGRAARLASLEHAPPIEPPAA